MAIKIVEKKDEKESRKNKEKTISLETDVSNLNKELELTGQHSTLLMILVDLGSTNKNITESYTIRELKNRKQNLIKSLDRVEKVFMEFINTKYKLDKIENNYSKIPDYLRDDSSLNTKENKKLYSSYLKLEKDLDVAFHFLKNEILDVYEYFRVNVAKLYLIFSDYNFTSIPDLKKVISKINFRYLEEYLQYDVYQKILLFQNIRVTFSHIPDAKVLFRNMNLRKFSTIKNTLIEAYDMLLWIFEDNREKMNLDFAKRFLTITGGKNYTDEEIIKQLEEFNETLLNTNVTLKK